MHNKYFITVSVAVLQLKNASQALQVL